MTVLLPRLPGPACDAIVRQFLSVGPCKWPGFQPDSLPPSVRFAATGGTPIGASALAGLRQELVVLAQRHGLKKGNDRSTLAEYDAAAAAWLARSDLFATGEALRDDVWGFVSAVVAPDIVHWRFGASPDRYAGGVRNTFQRLFMRGRALDRGADHEERWHLLNELTEDALVQVTERPSIGGDRTLAMAIGEAWVRAARYHGKAAMEDGMRRAILRIRILNETRALASLPPAILSNLLDQIFGLPAQMANTDIDGPKVRQPDFASPERSEDDHEQVTALQGARSVSVPPRLSTIERIWREADGRGWLSPKSRAALKNLQSGNKTLQRSERNALDHLLGRLSDAGTLTTETSILRSWVSEGVATDG